MLITASLLFYAYGEPVYVILMIFSALMNYIAARVLSGIEKGKKIVLFLGLFVNLGLLGIFKYAMFFVDMINNLFHINITCPEISLPIGISFFTFQAVSYVLDVYSGKVEAQKSFWKVLLYISFFPQLIAGPIVKYRDIQAAIDDRKQDSVQAALGMRRFICGLAKKVLIANAMGAVADAVFHADMQNVNIIAAWVAALAYMFQIYYDFSGYSDMAIGLGKMFGFQFQENFQYPYAASSIQEFWRRWHISLSTWFKEYLYIPLGGNRKGKARAALNRMIVFFLTGLWHGANWTFVLWGVYHGLLLLFEEYVPLVKKLPKWLAHIYTLLAVCVGFVMFRADTVTQGFFMIGQMVTGFSFSAAAMSLVLQQLTPYFIVMFLVAIVAAGPVRPVADRIRGKLCTGENDITKGWSVIQIVLYGASFFLLAWCMIRLSGGTYNPFIYFRF
ncbi:MAG: MBOAT family O-acyltransferase [Lachnospiraceae bacterium]